MKIIETPVYIFNELNEKAKEKARSWWRENDVFDDWYEFVMEDAKTIGLSIDNWETDSASFVRNVDCSFIVSAVETSEKIFDNHGKDCATYKAAQAFDDAIDKLPDGDSPDSSVDDMDVLEGDFMTALCECYRVMLQDSDEYIDDMLVANDYTFTATGERA